MLAKRIFTLTGEIDIYTASATRRLLDEVDGPDVLDLAGVRLMTAAGLTELARVANRVGHGRVTLVGALPHVRRVLRIAQFERLFLIE